MSAPSATINQPNFSINNNTRAYSSFVSYPQGTNTQTIQPTSLKGSQGPQGFRGEEGDCGDDGPQGPQGEVGPRGFLGAMGMQGYQGVVGPQGPVGDSNSETQKSVVSNYNNSIIELGDNYSDLVSISGSFNNPYITASVVCQSSTADVVVEFNLLRNGEQVLPYSYYYTMKKAGGYKTINLQFQDLFISNQDEYKLVAKGKSDSPVKISTSTIFVL